MPMSGSVEYKDASPEVRAVFDDIMATRQTDWINNFWKALARDPLTLKRTWEAIKQIMAPGALDADALGSGFHGVLHGPLHGPAEAHPTGQLVGHVLGDEPGLEFRSLHLEDVELDVAPGHQLEVVAQPVGLTNAPGSTATFSIGAANAGLAYRWRRNGTNLVDGSNISSGVTSRGTYRPSKVFTRLI